MKRLALPLTICTAALGGCGFYEMMRDVEGPTRGLQPDAVPFAIRELCVPAMRQGRPAADFARAPDAMPADPTPVRDTEPASGAWHVGGGVFVADQLNGACAVAVRQGRPDLLQGWVAAALRAEGFVPYREERQLERGQLHTRWCGGTPGAWIGASVRTRDTVDTRTAALQMSLFRTAEPCPLPA